MRLCESVLYFDIHALLTINAINCVPRFIVDVYGHVMSGILSVNMLKMNMAD